MVANSWSASIPVCVEVSFDIFGVLHARVCFFVINWNMCTYI